MNCQMTICRILQKVNKLFVRGVNHYIALDSHNFICFIPSETIFYSVYHVAIVNLFH